MLPTAARNAIKLARFLPNTQTTDWRLIEPSYKNALNSKRTWRKASESKADKLGDFGLPLCKIVGLVAEFGGMLKSTQPKVSPLHRIPNRIARDVATKRVVVLKGCLFVVALELKIYDCKKRGSGANVRISRNARTISTLDANPQANINFHACIPLCKFDKDFSDQDFVYERQRDAFAKIYCASLDCGASNIFEAQKL